MLLANAGDLDAALTEYTAALTRPATTDCAAKGRRELAHAFVERGNRLHDIGKADESLAAYTTAVQLDPETAAKIVAETRERTVTLVRRLHHQGLRTEAQTVLLAAVKNDPEMPLDDELGEVLSGGRPVPGSGMVWRMGAFLRAALTLLVGTLVATTVLLFVTSRVRRRLRVGEFTGPAGDDTKVTRVSTELRAQVRTRIADLAAAGGTGGRFDIADASSDAELPATLVDGLPHAALLGAAIRLLDRLVPSAERELRAVLLADAKSGRVRGVAVTMHARWRGARGTHVIWESTLPGVALAGRNTATYDQFVDEVAAWALWRFDRRAFRRLGTNDPASLAATTAAAALQGGAW